MYPTREHRNPVCIACYAGLVVHGHRRRVFDKHPPVEAQTVEFHSRYCDTIGLDPPLDFSAAKVVVVLTCKSVDN